MLKRCHETDKEGKNTRVVENLPIQKLVQLKHCLALKTLPVIVSENTVKPLRILEENRLIVLTLFTYLVFRCFNALTRKAWTYVYVIKNAYEDRWDEPPKLDTRQRLRASRNCNFSS